LRARLWILIWVRLGAQGTGAQRRLADGGAFLLVTFLCAGKEK